MGMFDFIVGLLTFSAGFLVGAFWVSAKGADAREYAWQDALMRVPAEPDVDSFVRTTGDPVPNGVRTPIWAHSGRRPIT